MSRNYILNNSELAAYRKNPSEFCRQFTETTVLKNPNGKLIKVIRKSTQLVPEVLEFGGIEAKSLPVTQIQPPELCHCIEWNWTDAKGVITARKPGCHHPICKFNEAWELAKEKERGKEVDKLPIDFAKRNEASNRE